jgi:hypothetical protein
MWVLSCYHYRAGCNVPFGVVNTVLPIVFASWFKYENGRLEQFLFNFFLDSKGTFHFLKRDTTVAIIAFSSDLRVSSKRRFCNYARSLWKASGRVLALEMLERTEYEDATPILYDLYKIRVDAVGKYSLGLHHSIILALIAACYRLLYMGIILRRTM